MQDNYFDRLVREKLANMKVDFNPSDWEVFVHRLSASLDALFRAKLEQEVVPYDPADWELMEAMFDEPFDRAIAERLSNVSVPFSETDWETMEAYLDASFDVAIRKKLQGVSAPYEAADWAIMEAALMHPFDLAVRKKLAHVGEDPAAPTWALMNEQLNAPFDEAVREKLGAYQKPFYKADWRRMAALLGHGQLRPFYQDWRSYAAAAVLLLLLLGGGNWRQPAPGLQELPLGEPTAVLRNAPEESVSAPRPSSQPFILPERKESAVSPASGSESPVQLPAQEQKQQAPSPRLVPDLVVTSPNQLASSSSGIPQKLSVDTGDQSQATLDPEQNHDSKEDAVVQRHQVFTLKSIRLQDQNSGVGLLGYSGFDKGPSTSIEIPAPPPYPSVGLSLYGAGFRSASQFNEQGKAGFASGLRVDLMLSDNWSLVTGLLYAEKHFSRTVYNSVPENNGMGAALTPTYRYWISKLEADYVMLEIPLLARYTFRNKSPVSFYLQAGFTTMLSLRESYRHYDPRSAYNVSITENNPSVDPSAYSEALEAYLGQLNPTPEERKISTYIGNLQMGPGMEVELTPQVQLQLESYLQLGILPMGAENIKLHSAGLGMGIRYLLNKPQ